MEARLVWLDGDVDEAALSAALRSIEGRAGVVGADVPDARRALFESAGFVARGESAVWTRAGPARAPTLPTGDFAIYPVSPAEIMELVQCDTPRSGAPRGPHLGALMAAHPHRAFVAVHRGTGAFSGHALGTTAGVGALLADAPSAAAWLLHAAERAGTPGRAVVAEWNADATALFRAAGYTREEARTRMTLGGSGLPGRPETHYAVDWSTG